MPVELLDLGRVEGEFRLPMWNRGSIISKSPLASSGQYMARVFWNQYCPPQSRKSALTVRVRLSRRKVRSAVKSPPLNFMG